MTEKLYFQDQEHGNGAIIEEVSILPYKGAAKREKGFRVTAFALYDNNFIYHVSVFETLEKAKADLKALCFEI